ncbi:2-oxo acid dehydrogenase subunit E2 [Kocuria coralli]|uniref:Dihydrolipoamide acetyltransferase component of pyruvate dehydrogenase complex n=1 Tax=Kocuria coralli TaxID=1461025 RepID=A0A5J5L172_9MICC|nr:dihydrolipoamide acetyltransferase family protein [Kocuria coralli]KAA9395390.1 2-oxo acid dehydrogenase subunit E2 [Kocuria coralli]
MSEVFALPDVGEGLTEAEIVSWKVGPGEKVVVDQVLLEIETAKSLVELPSPWDGTVLDLLVDEGRTVEVGTPLIVIGADSESPGNLPDPGYTGEADAASRASTRSGDNQDGKAGSHQKQVEGEEAASQQALVGSGPKADPVVRRRRQPTLPRRNQGAEPERRASQAHEAPRQGPGPAGRPSFGEGIADLLSRAGLGQSAAERPAWLGGRRQEAGGGAAPVPSTADQETPRRPALAKPPVRKVAKEMGIDLADVTGTGESGQVTKRDLLAYAAHLREIPDGPDSFWVSTNAPGAGDRTQRIPVKGVRKLTAQNMVKSAFTAPHVSIFVDVDASRTMEFVKRLKEADYFDGVKITPLLILAKAIIWATARNPQVNATWTDSEIIIKRYMNLGIAAATPRGLMVPNIKDAQDMSLRELAVALDNLTKTARAGKTQPGDMQNGTISITNIGSLGIDIGTPIINPGEVAIVAFGTIKQKPWVVDGEIIPRWITTLGGSFDHRVVDGDLSARFMADVAKILEEPALLLD